MKNSSSINNSFFEMLLEDSSNIVIGLSSNYNILEFNRVAEKVYKWRYKHIVNKNFLLLCKKHDFDCPISESILPNKGKAFTKTLRNKIFKFKRNIYNIKWTIKRCAPSQPHSLAILLIGHLKKHSHTEHLPQGFHPQLAGLVSNIPCCIYWKDLSGVYLGCNKFTLDTLGLTSLRQIVGKTDAQLWGVKETKELLRNDTQVMESGKALSYIEETMIIKGKKRTFTVVKMPLKDNHGKIIGIIGNAIEITELKQQTVGLQRTREKSERERINALNYLSNIVACTPGSLYWKDKNGRYLGCNDYMVQVAGMKSAKELIGKTDFELWEDQAEQLKKNDLEVMNSNKPIRIEEKVKLPNGKIKYFAVVKMPLKNDKGQVIGVIGNSLEITEIKEIEIALKEAKQKAETANLAKSEFIAVISHELRTPLNGILGLSEMLLRHQALPNEQKNIIKDIHKSGAILLNLVNDILDFSKLEAGKLEFIMGPFNLSDIIDDTVNSLSILAKQKDIKLLVDYKNNLPKYFVSDSHRIRQILFNLIGNAIKFTEKGHILISVGCQKESKHEANIKISVTDTGVGIPSDKLEFIFDKFNQLESNNRGQNRGTGLGLAIVKQLVDNFGGTLSVNSKVGSGSTFEVMLPLTLVKNSVHEVHDSQALASLNILIIDDNDTRAKTMRDQLIGAQVKISSSHQALEVLRTAENPYDIVIVDNEITAYDDIDLAKMILSTEKLNDIYLILSSQSLTIPQYERMKTAGYASILVKPIQPSLLIKSVEDFYQTKNLKAGLASIEAKKTHNLRALIVEDNEINQKVAKLILQDLKCEAVIAASGTEALDLLAKEQFDLIFLDIGLGDMDGYQVTSEIRKKEDNKAHLPIIGMTAHVLEEDRKRCFSVGMDEVLTKPVTYEQVRNVIQRWV